MTDRHRMKTDQPNPVQKRLLYLLVVFCTVCSIILLVILCWYVGPAFLLMTMPHLVGQ